MSDLLDSIREAIGEILLVIGLIDLLGNLQFVVDLGNLFNAGQITVVEYLFRFILRMVIIPAIPGILIGLFIHWIREALSR